MTKTVKWNSDLKIIDLFGIKGATAELRSYLWSYRRGREMENYCEIVIRYQNDDISIEKCVSLVRSKLERLNKVQGKRIGIEKLMNNRFYYIDMMRAKSMQEVEEIRQATILKNTLTKLYSERDILLKKKSEYEADYQKQEEKYGLDCKHINEPLGWTDKKIGSRLVGKKTRTVERIIGHTEGSYRVLPDKEPRSSFESPDYEQTSGPSPIYGLVTETVDVYEDIMLKEPILREPVPPQMGYGYADVIKDLEDILFKILIGETRKQYIEDHMDTY